MRSIILTVIYSCIFLITLSAYAETNNTEETLTLEKQLTGKWREFAWRSGIEGDDYIQYPEGFVSIHKVYWKNSFYYASYSPRGEVYMAYGGRYEIVDHNTIREVIEYYTPFSNTEIRYGADRRAVKRSGKSMVGAESIIDTFIEDNVMRQDGITHQNPDNVNDPESYGDMPIHHKYKKIHGE